MEDSTSHSHLLILHPVEDFVRIRSLWLELEKSAPHSYFVSWSWTQTWIDSLQSKDDLYCVAYFEDENPVCCFFLGVRSGIKHKFIYKNRAYLNEVGIAEIDDLTIEYNSPVGSSDSFPLAKLLDCDQFSSVEEINLRAVTKSTYEKLRIPEGFTLTLAKELPCYFVDLESIRNQGENYLNYLSPNKRGQIRRSVKHFENFGAFNIHEASSSDEALDMMGNLVRIHQKYWNLKGKPGAFASKFSKSFHENLIKSRFDSGEIQLLSFSFGRELIGYLYNFVYNDEVLYYQSGLNFGASNLSRPGLVCHYKAIVHNLERGYKSYNFLAGSSQYKKSLSTDSDSLYNLILAKNGWKFEMEQWMRSLVTHLKG